MSYCTTLLHVAHQKKNFSCGIPLLDQYLHTQARQDQSRKLCACFVLTDEEQRVKGYYTLSNCGIPKQAAPEAVLKKMPPAYHELPATLLGRLAVDQHFQGQRLGELLLLDALRRSFDNTAQVGSLAVVVDPIDKVAEKFYDKYGFISLHSGKMFLAMGTIAALFKDMPVLP